MQIIRRLVKAFLWLLGITLSLAAASIAVLIFIDREEFGPPQKARGGWYDTAKPFDSLFVLDFSDTWSSDENIPDVRLPAEEKMVSHCRRGRDFKLYIESSEIKPLPFKCVKGTGGFHGNFRELRAGPAIIAVQVAMDGLDIGLLTIEEFRRESNMVLAPDFTERLIDFVLAGKDSAEEGTISITADGPQGRFTKDRRLRAARPKEVGASRGAFPKFSPAAQLKLRENFERECRDQVASQPRLKLYCNKLAYSLYATELEQFIYVEDFAPGETASLPYLNARSRSGRSLLESMIQASCDNPNMGHCGVGYRSPPEIKKPSYRARLEDLVELSLPETPEAAELSLAEGCHTALELILASSHGLKLSARRPVYLNYPEMAVFASRYIERVKSIEPVKHGLRREIASYVSSKDSIIIQKVLDLAGNLTPEEEHMIALALLNSEKEYLVELGLKNNIRFTHIPGTSGRDSPIRAFNADKYKRRNTPTAFLSYLEQKIGQ